MEWLTPETPQEAADLLAERDGRPAPLPVTGASVPPERLPPGADPPAAVLSTARLAGVIEHRPRDLTVTVAAGTRMSELLGAMTEEGSWLSFGGPAVELSVGGAVASALPGPFDAGHGDLRRQLLGCELVTRQGERTRWGRGVMKNVAGYGATRAVAGSFGRLGAITAATFRLWPAPERRRRVRLRPDEGDALAAAARIATSDFDAEVRPDAVVWRRSGGPAGEDALVVWLAGTGSSVDLRLERLRTWAAEAGMGVGEPEAAPAPTEAGRVASGPFGRGRTERASAGWLSAGRDRFGDAARRAEEVLGDRLLALEGYPLSGDLRCAWAGAASDRTDGAEVALPGGGGGVPLRIERGGAGELSRAEARRSGGVRQLERRVVESFGGRPRDWLSGYL